MSEIKTFQKNEPVIKQGDKAAYAFQIVKGEVEVFLLKDERIVALATLGEGEIFGEGALLGGAEYNANVSAAQDGTEIAIITPEGFQEKLSECDPMIQKIISMITERLQDTNKALLHSETREFMDVDFI